MPGSQPPASRQQRAEGASLAGRRPPDASSSPHQLTPRLPACPPPCRRQDEVPADHLPARLPHLPAPPRAVSERHRRGRMRGLSPRCAPRPAGRSLLVIQHHQPLPIHDTLPCIPSLGKRTHPLHLPPSHCHSPCCRRPPSPSFITHVSSSPAGAAAAEQRPAPHTRLPCARRRAALLRPFRGGQAPVFSPARHGARRVHVSH